MTRTRRRTPKAISRSPTASIGAAKNTPVPRSALCPAALLLQNARRVCRRPCLTRSDDFDIRLTPLLALGLHGCNRPAGAAAAIYLRRHGDPDRLFRRAGGRTHGNRHLPGYPHSGYRGGLDLSRPVARRYGGPGHLLL